ncbi:transposase family protein [Parvularcula maris]|uniref:Transposase family protein n=1 Tax=Parvularcula maris TaxID=2965077 RepID=A0A9X2LB65_9PROT|nr:transposase family protein [Parvularcula maris]MCQ8186503.1 transposase family protein [Parvularcula maris]
MVGAATFSPGKAFAVTAIELVEDGYEVELEDRRKEGSCPACGSCSVRSYGWHRRTLQDLPIAGRAVRHRVALRRWSCANEQCSRRTFTQADVTVFQRYSRRTLRFNDIVLHMGRALSGLLAECFFERLGLSINDDTVVRHLSRETEEKKEGPPPRVVGIDDWAWKKQHSYGTIMLNVERNTVIDVIKNEDGQFAMPSPASLMYRCLGLTRGLFLQS